MVFDYCLNLKNQPQSILDRINEDVTIYFKNAPSFPRTVVFASFQKKFDINLKDDLEHHREELLKYGMRRKDSADRLATLISQLLDSPVEDGEKLKKKLQSLVDALYLILKRQNSDPNAHILKILGKVNSAETEGLNKPELEQGIL